MNTKQAVEAYVRKACGLDKLERVWICDGEVYDNFQPNEPSAVIIREGQMPDAFVEMQEVRFVSKKFIGSPIHLEHWLSALDGKVRLDVNFSGTMSVYDGKDNEVNFNLQTGQPATEADYKALAQLLDIKDSV